MLLLLAKARSASMEKTIGDLVEPVRLKLVTVSPRDLFPTYVCVKVVCKFPGATLLVSITIVEIYVQMPYALYRRVLIYKLNFLYKRSEFILDVFFLEPFLFETSSYITLHLILWGGDQVCHCSLIFITHLRIFCSSVEVRHLLMDLIYSHI